MNTDQSELLRRLAGVRNRSVKSDVEALIAENQDGLSRTPEIQTSRFVMTSRRFVSRRFDRVSVRLNSAFLHDAIALAKHDDAGLQCLTLCLGTWAKLMMVRTSPLFPP